MLTRRYAIIIAGTAAIAALGALVGVSAQRVESARRTPLEWGIYQILWSNEYCAHVQETVSRLASRPDYVMFYRDLMRPYPKQVIQCLADQGATPIVSLELWHWRTQQPELADINAGKYDEHFRSWALAAKEHGRRVLWRFGFEFNGNWFTWSLDPDAYVTAWRRVRGIFAEVGATHVEWVWAPNLVSCPDTPENNMHLYYPGDEHVDWVGVDGYNFGDHHDEWHRWQSFESLFTDVLDDLARRYPGKRLMIAEFAAADNEPGLRATWIREAYAFLQKRPEVRAAIWFNYDKRREGEPNWRIDTSPESLRAFNATFAAPR